MNINWIKILIISLSMISINFLSVSFSALAASRGIVVKAKTSSGSIKEIQLYSGYYALVVGVSDYVSWPDLPNASKDAHDIARVLKKMGFKVNTITNPSSRELKKALNDLTYKYGQEPNRALLFYFAGHGETEKLADGTKLGHLIPRDCPLLKEDPQGFVNKAVSMKDIEAYSLRIRAKHVLMLFDSCFSGSLFSLVRAVPEDITEKIALPVRQYITAGTEDETVPDRSMFKRCLILGLEGDADLTRDGYITGTELGLYLSDKVVQSTHRTQHPQYGKIAIPELARGDFVFRLASSSVVVDISGKATLSVKSNVSGAEVFVDGQKMGTTQLSEVAISAGEHRILVEKSGYEAYRKTIHVKQGYSIPLYVDLKLEAPKRGRLYIDTQPNGAMVRILNIDQKFHQGIELEVGSYHIEVSAYGYKTKKLWVSLVVGEDKTLNVRLNRISISRQSQKITIGIETFGLPYFSGGSGGTIWLGKNHFKVRGGIANLKTPSVYLRDGFENDSFKLTVFNIEYFLRENYNGLWFGSGIDSFNGTIGHEDEIELGSYEHVRWGLNMGYSYKLINNFYINTWGGLYTLIIGDTETQVGSRTVYFDDSVPIISIDLGWHF